MMSVAAEGLGDDLFEPGFHFVDVLAGREAGAVAHSEDVGVDRESLLAESGVEDDIGGLAADAGELLQQFARSRHLAAEAVDQRLAERDDVPGLGVEQTDGFDRVSQQLLAQIDHLARLFDPFEQRARGDIDAGVGACAERTTATSNW